LTIKTGKPVEGARVIVSFWNSELTHFEEVWPERYEIQADTGGRFSLDGYQCPSSLGGSTLRHSSPNDQYALAISGNALLAPFARHFQLRMQPINDPTNRRPWLHYKSFPGTTTGKSRIGPASAHVRVPFEN